VGLLDLDLYGPSSHIILGMTNFNFPEEDKGIIPPKINDIHFISTVYFTEDKPAPLRGVDITNIIIELFAIVQWKELDYLIIDMPPGIGNEVLDIIKYVKKCEFLVVTTSSKVSMGSVGKLLKILKELDIPIIGVLENMKMNESQFIEDNISKMSIQYIGSVPFDQDLEEAIGNGNLLLKTNFMMELDNCLKRIDL
jgi:ATP-binding protein involved in chromosome partitioning